MPSPRLTLIDMPSTSASALAVQRQRDAEPLYQQTLARLQEGDDFWVFGYASLIWRPEFVASEQRPARVHGHHRSLRMSSRLNRGTPQQPGLVFALLPGGSCRGIVYRIERARAEVELQRLWAREMPGGAYDPKWLLCQTAEGPVSALSFTLSRRSPSYTGALDEAAMLGILRHASGRFGSTLDYLVETARCLHRCGIRDHAVERHVALARRHGLAA